MNTTVEIKHLIARLGSEHGQQRIYINQATGFTQPPQNCSCCHCSIAARNIQDDWDNSEHM